MKPEEYLIACRAIHIELERVAHRLMELAQFRCAEPSNQAFLNLMERHASLLDQLASINDKLATQRNAARDAVA